MGEVIGLHDRPLKPDRAIARVRKLWREGNVAWTVHAQKQMRRRRITIPDVQHVIRYGRVTGSSRPLRLWRYRVEGETVDRGNLRVIVEIDGNLIVITTYPRRKKRKKRKR